MKETVIEARALVKAYGAGTPHQVQALDGVDFEVYRGEIFGLIGADGAGKTTAFKIMAGVLQATSGEIRVLGGPPRQSRQQVGYLTQPFSLYPDLSVLENLSYAAGLREVPPQEFDERRSRYLTLFEMAAFEERLAGQLSGGMKQKLALSCALIFNPKILLLDEPTTGVDPVSRRDFWDALTSLSSAGITIVVATPYYDEAERCHRIALMERGKILQVDPPSTFRSGLGLTRLGVRTGDLPQAEAALSAGDPAAAGLIDLQRFGDRLDVMVADAEQGERLVRQRLSGEGIEIRDLRRSPPTLENAFVSTLRRRRGHESLIPFPYRRLSASQPRNAEEAAVVAAGLSKRFGAFQAVKDFSVEIRYGEVYGLLGANGAGKTTAIKMICGLLQPTSGQVALLGQSRKLRSARIRSQIGYMSQKFTLYDDLTIGENLDFYARLYGLSREDGKRRKEWVLEVSGLSGQAEMPTQKLPGGWKQRVAFGAAVMHEPRVIFLDEPTSGVDPLARRVMWRMINDLADRGAAILVVTHYLEEAEQCNRLGFMAAGEMVAEGAPGDVKAQMRGHLLEVTTPSAPRAHAVLKEQFGPGRVSLFGDRLHVVADDPAAGRQSIRSALAERQIDVAGLEEIDFSLEDVFISMIEERRQAASHDSDVNPMSPA